MKRFQYYRRYLLTGEESIGEMDAENARELLESLNDYNRTGAGYWQYWATPDQLMGQHVTHTHTEHRGSRA